MTKRATLLAAFALWTALALVPFEPREKSEPRETSWTQVLHVAFDARMQFGRDIIFSHGPWGFLLRGFHPRTYPVVLTAWLFLTLTYATTLALLFTRPECKPWADLGLLVVALGITAFWSLEVFLFALVFATSLLALRQDVPGWTKDLAATALALAALTKFTIFTLATVAVGFSAFDDAIVRRRAPRFALVFAIQMLLLWLLAGQRLDAFIPYLRSSFELASSYPQAMARGPQPLHDPAGWFVASALLFLLALLTSETKRLAIPFAIVFFLLFKSAFTRHDVSHTTPAYVALLLAQLLYLGSHRRELGARARWWSVTLFTGALAIAWIVCASFPPRGMASHVASVVARTPSRIATLARLPEVRRTLEDGYRTRARALARRYPISGVVTPADIYPSHQSILFAHGIGVSMRPVFESYAAFSEPLARANARHLESESAPRSILFDVDPIDGRFPAFEDGFSWPALLGRYDLAGESGGVLRLERRARARHAVLRPHSIRRAKLGERVSVPKSSTGLVWVAIEIEPTLSGRLRAAVWKPARLRLRTDEREWRLVPELARAGFLISPLVTDRASFAALMRGEPGRNCESLSVDLLRDADARHVESPVEFRFFELAVE